MTLDCSSLEEKNWAHHATRWVPLMRAPTLSQDSVIAQSNLLCESISAWYTWLAAMRNHHCCITRSQNLPPYNGSCRSGSHFLELDVSQQELLRHSKIARRPLNLLSVKKFPKGNKHRPCHGLTYCITGKDSFSAR